MKRVIVTGATSFIGAPLVNALLADGNFVYAVIRPNSKKIDKIPVSNNVKIIECDLDNINNLDSIICKDCDVFYHIAWDGTRSPERDDCELQFKNYKACLKAYDIAKKLKCNTFISVGSQAEYGKCTGNIDEKYEANPITEYGKAKLLSFQTIQKLAPNDGIKFGWIRLFSAYGPNDYQNSLISTCLEKMKKNESIELTSGTQFWNYVFIDDVVNILILLMKSNNYKSDVFNVCSNDNRRLKSYVMELKEILSSSSELLFGIKGYNSKEQVVSFQPLNRKVEEVLKYNKYVTFRDGITKILSDKN